MEGSDKVTRENKYEVIDAAKDVCVVSYLASSGWTLTAILDEKAHKVTAVASNDKQLVVQHGKFMHLRRAST
jgi:hypothetical protein